MNEVQIRVATAFVAGGLVSGGIVYAVTKKKYRDLAESEIADMKAYYAKKEESRTVDPDLGKTSDSDRPLTQEELDEQINRGYADKLANLGYAEKADLESEGLPSKFELNDEDDEEPVEDPSEWERDFEKPYVINVNEYNLEHMDNPNWEKVSLTYYEEDDTLASEDGQSITDVEGVVGLANLAHFGVGSSDEDIVYIRNEDLDTDFEITKVSGSYTQLALGIDEWNAEDIQQPTPKVKKMRGDGQ